MIVLRWALLLVACGAAIAQAQPAVLDLTEAAALLRLPVERVRELAEAQRLPARRVGGEWRFPRDVLLAWLAGRSAPRATDPPPIGDRPAERSAEEVALRDQRALLKRGAASVDFGLAYARGEQSLAPLARTEGRSGSLTTALRYGIANDLQLTARIGGAARRTDSYTQGTNADRPATTRDHYLTDASVSLLGVAMREAAWRPNVIISLDTVLPSGPGDRGIGTGLVLAKSYDPAVVFLGLSYMQGLAVEQAANRRSLAIHNYSFSAGYTFAVNDTIALNTVLSGSYRDYRSADGTALPAARERYQLQLGMPLTFSRGLYIEPAATFRIGGAAPDLTLSTNLHYPL